MAGAPRYLLNRNGRFFARLVVPKELRQIVGKSELRTALGPDLRTAMKHLPAQSQPSSMNLPKLSDRQRPAARPTSK